MHAWRMRPRRSGVAGVEAVERGDIAPLEATKLLNAFPADRLWLIRRRYQRTAGVRVDRRALPVPRRYRRGAAGLEHEERERRVQCEVELGEEEQAVVDRPRPDHPGDHQPTTPLAAPLPAIQETETDSMVVDSYPRSAEVRVHRGEVTRAAAIDPPGRLGDSPGPLLVAITKEVIAARSVQPAHGAHQAASAAWAK